MESTDRDALQAERRPPRVPFGRCRGAAPSRPAGRRRFAHWVRAAGRGVVGLTTGADVKPLCKPVRRVDWSIVHSVNGFLAGHDAIEDPLLAYVQVSQALFLGMLVLVCAFARHERWLGVRRAAVAAGLSAGLGLLIGKLITELYVRPRPFVAHPGAVHLFASHATDASFPSDHATASVAIGVAVLLRSKLRWGLVTLAFALILWFGRVGLGFHYPTDVLGPRRNRHRRRAPAVDRAARATRSTR